MNAGDPVTIPVGGLEAAGYPCDAEVRQLGFAVLGEQDVRGFDVTVQRAQPMCSLQGSGHLHSNVQRLHPVRGPAVWIRARRESRGWYCITMYGRPDVGSADVKDR